MTQKTSSHSVAQCVGTLLIILLMCLPNQNHRVSVTPNYFANLAFWYFHCGLNCFMFGAVQFLNVLVLTLLCFLLFNLVKLTELPPVWERAANSAYHLLFLLLVKICLFSSPFDV